MKYFKKFFLIIKTIFLGLVLTTLTIILYTKQPHIFKAMDRAIYDLFLKNTNMGEPTDKVVIVDIDEHSLEKYGQWPWPRYMVAEIMQKIADAGAKTVTMDILISEEDRTSPTEVERQLRTLNVATDILKDIPEKYRDYDLYLSDVIKNIPTVFAFYAKEVAYSKKYPKPLTIVTKYSSKKEMKKKDINPLEKIIEIDSALFPLESISINTTVGFTNVQNDLDGVIRDAPLILKVNNKIYPSLALASLMKYENIKYAILHYGNAGLETLQIGKHHIPLNSNATIAIAFKGKAKTFKYYTATDLLENKLKTDAFKDKIVLIGSSAMGLLDIRATPYDPYYPGIEVHASVIDTILNKSYTSISSFTPAIQSALLILLGITFPLIFRFLHSMVYFLVFITSVSSIVFISYYLYGQGIYITPVYILFNIVLNAVIFISIRFWTEEQHKKYIQNVFGKYVSPELVAQIATKDDDFTKGQKRDLCILFSDIRDFSSISEKLEPQAVVEFLNRYFTPMTTIIRENKGTVDKFIGDAIMAFWNAPLEVENYTYSCVKSAMEMLDKLNELNQELIREFGFAIYIGIGIHTDNVYVGNMGTDQIMNYTIIGDGVNLASRLEGVSKIYRKSIIVSDDTVQRYLRDGRNKDVTFLPIDKIRVKGREQALDIHIPIFVDEYNNRFEEMVTFIEGRAYYDIGEFEMAKENFERAREMNPYEYLYELYSQRCDQLMEIKPENWDGCWTYTTK